MSSVNQNGNAVPNKDEPNGQSAQPDKIQYDYLWITDEGLLRDEGTLYGIAGAPFKDKVDAIRNYFNIKKAVLLQKKESFEQEITTNEELINSLEADAKGKRGRFENLIKERKGYDLGPIIFHLLAYLSICYFNYYLINYWLAPGAFSQFICLGLYLLGLFSVFFGRSIMYNSYSQISNEKEDVKREQWKVYLEEFGIPIVVSAFICILTFKYYPIEYSIGAFALFLFLFLFTGKGLINLQFRLRKELSSFLSDSMERRKLKKEDRELSNRKKEIEKSSSELIKNAQEPLGIMKSLEAEEAYKIHVFMSEYNLASESRQPVDDNPLKKLA